MNNKFYVYEHWRTDTNEPFYVGKGCNGRAHKMGEKGNRNLHHRAIEIKLKRLGLKIDIKIVARFETSDEACSYEMERISHWLALGMELVNRTAGGDGLRNPTPETRELLATYHRGLKASEETRKKMRESHAVRPKQTAEQIEKARVNRLAVATPMSAHTKALLSVAQKAHWKRLNGDPEALEKMRMQRSSASKKMWTNATSDRREAQADHMRMLRALKIKSPADAN
jgi:hypothetical protein